MSNKYGPRIVTDGLVLCLDAADRNSYPGSGTSWGDLSGNGNNGTLTNGPTFNSSNGGSIVFDGVNDKVDCGTFSVPYVTVSTWVYKTSLATNQGICRKQNAWAVSVYNGVLQVAAYTSWVFRSTSYTIPLNTWKHIAYTYSGTGSYSQSVYVDGSLIFYSSYGTGALSSNNYTARVGYDDNNWYWNGKIANTQIYNRALSASEVLQNYNATKGRFGL